MAMVAGLLAGVGLVRLAEHLDDRLPDAQSVLAALELPTLACVPQARSGVNACNPTDEAVVASFSELRSNVLSVLDSLQPAALLAVTSANDGDGKSAVAANLATALGHTGRKVILIDADLARPAQAALFQIKATNGLAALLSGRVDDAAGVLEPTCVDNVEVLGAGAAQQEARDPAGLLLSKRLPGLLDDLRSHCDVLVVDTPAVLGCPEGAWLSARADAVVLVLDARQARKRSVQPAVDYLRDAGASVVGVVLNRVNGRDAVRPSVAGGREYASGVAHGASSLQGADGT
jgi:capsular exopolysaccharide synthesis family protein